MLCTALFATYLMFGDSRCLIGYPSSPTLGGLIQTACPGITMLQNCRLGRGVLNPGQGATGTPLQELEAMLTQWSPDVCLLPLGYNDWAVAGTTPEAVAEGMKELGDACLAAGAEPVIITATPASDNGTPTRGAWTAEVRMRLISLGAALGWRVIDSVDAFDERTWHSQCTVNNGVPDGVHPWALACREQWADYVARRIP